MVAAGDGRTQGATEEDLEGSGEGGRGEVTGMERPLAEAVEVVLVGREQTLCSGCKAASRRARAASPGMAIAVRIVGGTLLGVVVLARTPKP